VPLSREKLNELHELGGLLESLTANAYASFIMGRAKASEELVRTAEDLIEDTKGVVEELLAPPP